jgi:hypothetical protein
MLDYLASIKYTYTIDKFISKNTSQDNSSKFINLKL